MIEFVDVGRDLFVDEPDTTKQRQTDSKLKKWKPPMMASSTLKPPPGGDISMDCRDETSRDIWANDLFRDVASVSNVEFAERSPIPSNSGGTISNPRNSTAGSSSEVIPNSWSDDLYTGGQVLAQEYSPMWLRDQANDCVNDSKLESTVSRLFRKSVTRQGEPQQQSPQGDFDALYRIHVLKIKERYSQPISNQNKQGSSPGKDIEPLSRPSCDVLPSSQIGFGLPLNEPDLEYQALGLFSAGDSSEPWELDGFRHMLIHRTGKDRFVLLWAPDFYGATAAAFIGTRHMDRWLLWMPPTTNKPILSPTNVEVNDTECKIHSTLQILLGIFNMRRYALYLGGTVPRNQRSLLFDVHGNALKMFSNPTEVETSIYFSAETEEEVVYWPGAEPEQVSERDCVASKTKKKASIFTKRNPRRSLMDVKIHKRDHHVRVSVPIDSDGENVISPKDDTKKKQTAQSNPAEIRRITGERPDAPGSKNHRILELINPEGDVVLYLSKRQKDVYRLDFTPMFTTFQAFALALIHFSSSE